MKSRTCFDAEEKQIMKPDPGSSKKSVKRQSYEKNYFDRTHNNFASNSFGG